MTSQVCTPKVVYFRVFRFGVPDPQVNSKGQAIFHGLGMQILRGEASMNYMAASAAMICAATLGFRR